MSGFMIEPCVDCVVQRRCGSLPCHYRSEFDILMLNMDSPEWLMISCPHHIPTNDPSKLIEWM